MRSVRHEFPRRYGGEGASPDRPSLACKLGRTMSYFSTYLDCPLDVGDKCACPALALAAQAVARIRRMGAQHHLPPSTTERIVETFLSGIEPE